MPTKKAFMTALENELTSRYTWARDEAKLARFMASVSDTLTGKATSWNKNGDASEAAWRAIGQKGKPTYKALRALDD